MIKHLGVMIHHLQYTMMNHMMPQKSLGQLCILHYMVNSNLQYITCLYFNIFHPNASPKGAKTEDGNSAAWHPKERHTHIAPEGPLSVL